MRSSGPASSRRLVDWPSSQVPHEGFLVIEGGQSTRGDISSGLVDEAHHVVRADLGDPVIERIGTRPLLRSHGDRVTPGTPETLGTVWAGRAGTTQGAGGDDPHNHLKFTVYVEFMDAGALTVLLIFALPTLAVGTGLYLLVRILGELQLVRRDLHALRPREGATPTPHEQVHHGVTV